MNMTLSCRTGGFSVGLRSQNVIQSKHAPHSAMTVGMKIYGSRPRNTGLQDSQSVGVPSPRRFKFGRQDDVCHATWQTVALTKVGSVGHGQKGGMRARESRTQMYIQENEFQRMEEL